MDTTQDFRLVADKIKAGAPLSYREVAVIISNDEQTLLKFLSDNDYKQVYRLLHDSEANLSVGKNAAFIPDKKRVDGELRLLLEKKDFKTLNDIVSNFIINTTTQNYTTNQKLLSSMEDIKTIFYDNGYRFNVTLS